jgi:uncharacterized protein YbaP (TraB family)
MRLIILLLAGVLSLAARGADKSAAASTAKHHCLWKVQPKEAGATNAVYLLGSVHMLSKSNYPLPMAIEQAYSNSSTLVFEADIGEMDQETVKLLGKAALPEGKTLATELTPETYALLTNHAASSGLPLFMLERLAPGVAAVTIEGFELVKMGMDPSLGLDKHFYDLGKKEGKAIVGLETPDFQMSLLTGLSKVEGDLMMKTTLKELDTFKTEITDLIQGWESGNAERVGDILNQEVKEAPDIYKRLLTDRNERWVPEIEKLMEKNKSALVIVGAGHLVGKKGVVEMLRQKGWKVSQM